MMPETKTRAHVERVVDEPEFDLIKLKVELNNITIMYGPPNATLAKAERAMMAYIGVLLGPVEEGSGS